MAKSKVNLNYLVVDDDAVQVQSKEIETQKETVKETETEKEKETQQETQKETEKEKETETQKETETEKENDKETEVEIKAEDVLKEIVDAPDPKLEDFDIKDWKKFGKAIGLEPTENTVAAFKESYEVHLKAQQQKIDMSEYGDAEKTVLEHLKGGGDINDFLDPLAPINKAMALDPDEKVRIALKADGLKYERIEAKIAEMKEDAVFDAYVAEIDNDLAGIRDSKIKEVAEQVKQAKIENNKKLSVYNEAEKGQLITVVKNMKTYRGVPVSSKIHNQTIEKINDGSLYKEVNNAESMIRAYYDKHYRSAVDQYHQRISEDKETQAYNRGFAAGKAGLHETKIDQSNAGHSKTRKAGDKPDLSYLKGE